MKRAAINSVDFMKVFAREARAGKSALEIGQVLGLTGDTDKVATYVSVKASQLRKRLADAALAQAKHDGLDAVATEALVKATTSKLPRIHSERKRQSKATNLISALDSILASLDAGTEVSVTPEPVSTDKPKRRK